MQPIQTNTAYKRSVHMGGKYYLIFVGPNVVIKSVYIKEWNGQGVTNQGISLTIARTIMVMHFGQHITKELDKNHCRP